MQKRLITICILTLGISAKSAHAQFSKTIRHLSVSTEDNNAAPLQLDAHDIDLDGDLDVLATFADGVLWFENFGLGHFSDGKHIDFRGNPNFKSAQFRDLDGDGVPDLAAGFGWRKNLGNGNFGPEKDDFWKEVAGSCDLNDDGLADVVYHSDNVIRLDRNLGGMFSPEATNVGSGANAKVFGSADFDLNQKEDLLIAHANNFLVNKLYWAKNEGNGAFTKIEIPAGVPKSLASGDVDGNGKMDVCLAFNTQIIWIEFDAYGNQTTRQTIPVSWTASSGFALGDIDADGDLDIFLGNATIPNGNRPAVLVFDASSKQFDPAPQTHAVMPAAVSVPLLADFDGNGNIDVFAFQPSAANRFAVFMNNGQPGIFEAPGFTSESLSYVNQILPADLDADGDPDFIAADFLFEKIAPEKYASRKKMSFPHLEAKLADLDGDGLPDVVYPKNDAVYWQRNLGNMSFGNAIKLDGFVALTDFVGVADFDADGDFDLCAANGTGANPNFALLIWYENDGAGNFTKHILNNFINWVNAALPLDVNSDGRPDIYLEMGNLQADFWYENLGNGAFSQRQSFFPPDADEPTFVNQRVAVDLDVDGRQDLVFSSDDSDESRIFWYQNLGNGAFSDLKMLYTATHPGSASQPFFTVYDAGNDGTNDLAISVDYPRRLVLLRGLGGGDFSSPEVLFQDLGVGGYRAIVPYDVDDDGKPDLLFGNRRSNLTDINRISWLSGQADTPPQPETCPRNFVFTRQSEIDSFPIKYPTCRDIAGNLVFREYTGSYNPNDPVSYDLSPLLGIHTVRGGVYFFRGSNPNLRGLDSLTTIGKDLEITNGYVLSSLAGLDNLRSVGGNLVIRDNAAINTQPKLKNLHGLENLERVGGDFQVFEKNMEALDGLQSLDFVGGNLDIRRGKMPDLKGLENLDTIGKSIIITELNRLKSLTGLENLRHAGLDISSDSLADLQGLSNLNSGRALRIVGNKLLQTLDGIENLQVLTGYNLTTPIKRPVIHLADNPKLSDISALDRAISMDDDGLYLLNNPSLSQCDAEAICLYLPTVPDTVSVAGNLPNCNSETEISNACDGLAALSATLSGAGEVCVGDSLGLTVTFTGNAPYTFVYAVNGVLQPPLTTTENPYAFSVSPANGAVYALQSVSNAQGSGSVSGAVFALLFPVPTAAIAGPDTICPGDTIMLTASGSLKYLWNTGATTAQISVHPTITTTYTVTVSNAYNCPDTAAWTVVVKNCTSGVFPADSDLENKGFQIFPNPLPLSEPLWVMLDNNFTGLLKFEVVTLEGRVLAAFFREKNAREISEILEIPKIWPDIFILRVSDGEKSAARLVLRK